MGEGRNLGSRGHPAAEIGFERALIDVAVSGWFARNFGHDVAAAGEEDLAGVEEGLGALLPELLFGAGGLKETLDSMT